MTGVIWTFIVSWFFMLLIIALFSCTVNLQNIDTHGNTKDCANDKQASDPTINPNVSIPLLK